MRMPTRDGAEPKTPTSSVTLGTLLLSPSSRLRFSRRDLFSLPRAPFSQTARRTDRPAALQENGVPSTDAWETFASKSTQTRSKETAGDARPLMAGAHGSGPRSLSKCRIGNVTGAEQRFDSACPSKAVRLPDGAGLVAAHAALLRPQDSTDDDDAVRRRGVSLSL